jgi:hypothetical protein
VLSGGDLEQHRGPDLPWRGWPRRRQPAVVG